MNEEKRQKHDLFHDGKEDHLQHAKKHHETTLLIGLGDAALIDALTIHWPGAGTSTWEALPADLRLDIAFGGEILEQVPLPAAAAR